ncbi:MAG: hypothetical protein CVT92_06880 [Bacteroidetes bacterium HGW-Bacteroidetes-1]|nr:MAG: hypothetical protein CVT92_06880 [Bacteroidetes bacterium HGW-Bacteroidetes-1]
MNSTFLLLTVSMSVLIIALVYLMLQMFFKSIKVLLDSFQNNLSKLIHDNSEERKSESLKIILPLRVQASERLVLFLERMQPSLLVSRHLNNFSKANDLTQIILQNIREEFEHNLSQQLYVSSTAWQLTKTVREEVIQMIHLAYAALPEDASATEMAKKILGSEVKMIDHAIQRLREDLNKYA